MKEQHSRRKREMKPDTVDVDALYAIDIDQYNSFEDVSGVWVKHI
jgi:hypothetical protein